LAERRGICGLCDQGGAIDQRIMVTLWHHNLPLIHRLQGDELGINQQN